MTNDVLIVIDMQNDFVTGALGSVMAENIVDKVTDKVNKYIENGCRVIFTKDTHNKNYLSTMEGKKLSVEHCIKDSEGWQLCGKLASIQEENELPVIEKSTFASISLADDMIDLYQSGDLDNIEIVGLCTDICVVANALLLKAFLPETEITVDCSCCAGTTMEKHNAAIATMESCQINIIGKDR